MVKVEYIKCPICGGIVSNEERRFEYDECFSPAETIFSIRGTQPRCIECGVECAVSVKTKGIMKIEVKTV